jgi:hypothetical protein
MVTAWIFTIPSAALLAAAAWEISDLFSSSAAGSVVIALIAAAGAVVLFKLAQRTKVTPDQAQPHHRHRGGLGGAAPADRPGERLRQRE